MPALNKLLQIFVAVALFTTACKNNPTTPEAVENVSGDLHTVLVNETIPSSKYLYVKVKEGDEEYWIATSNQEITVGGIYYFSKGILKLNFESEEIDRVFDKIYLVSSLVSADHGMTHNEISPSKSESESVKTTKKVLDENSISISELVKNSEKYAGKRVRISGKCVKINPNIMGKNWIHLKDGSYDDFDLVVTSETLVSVGSVVTMTAVLSLNKDFGAGYKYDLILEDGVVLH